LAEDILLYKCIAGQRRSLLKMAINCFRKNSSNNFTLSNDAQEKNSITPREEERRENSPSVSLRLREKSFNSVDKL
jgi:hypothetical protein